MTMLARIPDDALAHLVKVHDETRWKKEIGDAHAAAAGLAREYVARFAWAWYHASADRIVLTRRIFKMTVLAVRVRDLAWLFVLLFGSDPASQPDTPAAEPSSPTGD